MVYPFDLCALINLHKPKLCAGNEVSWYLKKKSPGKDVPPPGRGNPGDVPGDADMCKRDFPGKE